MSPWICTPLSSGVHFFVIYVELCSVSDIFKCWNVSLSAADVTVDKERSLFNSSGLGSVWPVFGARARATACRDKTRSLFELAYILSVWHSPPWRIIRRTAQVYKDCLTWTTSCLCDLLLCFFQMLRWSCPPSSSPRPSVRWSSRGTACRSSVKLPWWLKTCRCSGTKTAAWSSLTPLKASSSKSALCRTALWSPGAKHPSLLHVCRWFEQWTQF